MVVALQAVGDTIVDKFFQTRACFSLCFRRCLGTEKTDFPGFRGFTALVRFHARTAKFLFI